MRKPAVARVIAIGVSKSLASDIEASIPWESLLDEAEVHKFVDHLRATGAIGVDGLISKLDRLAIALSFLKAVVLDRNDQAKYHKAQRVEDALRRWKGGLRPLKKQENIERLEALSEESLSLQQVNEVVDDHRMWKDFWKTVRKVEDGGHISKEEKNLCVTVVLVMLLFKNWQRPGAVVNLKVKEYRQAKPVVEGGKEVLVIPVHDHKT